MSDTPVFDLDGAMERVENDKELYFELIDLLNDQFDESVENMKAAIDTQDGDSLNSVAHGIKSALGNVGAMSCYALAYKLERCGKEKNLAEANDLLGDLEIEFVKFSAEVEKFRV